MRRPNESIPIAATDAVRALYDGQGAEHAHKRERPGFLRWLARRDLALLDRLLDVRPGLSGLDAGCGAGAHARRMKRAGLSVCAVDFSPVMVEAVRPDVDEAIVASLEELRLGRRLDRVLCWGVLEYTSDPVRCLENLADHVATGGCLIVQVPRRSIGGLLYGIGYRVVYGIRVHLFSARALDDVARRRGLRLTERMQPFFHNVVLVWTRDSD